VNTDDLHYFFDAEFAKLIIKYEHANKHNTEVAASISAFHFIFKDLKIGKQRKKLLKLLEIMFKKLDRRHPQKCKDLRTYQYQPWQELTIANGDKGEP
jgi:CRISPR/Cas system-associated protein Cas10 (large subunit of type III CRISPR-Cas system)